MSDHVEIAWSHSRVNAFETCPKKFFHLSIAKDVQADFGPEADWGKAVHKALERRLRMGAELPQNMSQYEKHARKVERLAEAFGARDILAEQQLAVSKQLKPCGWFGSGTWARAILDVLILNERGGKALVFDWKTGKRKHDDRQLAGQAAFVFRHHPDIQQIVSGFIWLKENGAMDKITFKRANETRLWRQYAPTVKAMTEANRLGEWPAKPSGLCQKYCPVTACKFNGGYQG